MSKNLPLTAGAQLLKTASRARDLSYILEESLGKVLKWITYATATFLVF